MAGIGSGEDRYVLRRLHDVVDRAGEYWVNGHITELEMCRMVACEAAGLGLDALAVEAASEGLDAALAKILEAGQ